MAVFSVATLKGRLPEFAQVVADRFGSESISKVCPYLENRQDRQTALVVLPTPPLKDVRVMNLVSDKLR